jgi:hypothetical protein
MVTPLVALPATDGPIVRGQVSRAPQPLADFEREVRALTRSQP